MEIKIEESIIEAATECERNFECLSNGNNIYCEVEYCLNKEIYFVKCKYDKLCSYKEPFGSSFLCSCPTRKEIYNKYKI